MKGTDVHKSSSKRGGLQGLEKADARQKHSNFRKIQGEQLRPFKIRVILHPSLTEKGQPGLHDLPCKDLHRALVKTQSLV